MEALGHEDPHVLVTRGGDMRPGGWRGWAALRAGFLVCHRLFISLCVLAVVSLIWSQVSDSWFVILVRGSGLEVGKVGRVVSVPLPTSFPARSGGSEKWMFAAG